MVLVLVLSCVSLLGDLPSPAAGLVPTGILAASSHHGVERCPWIRSAEDSVEFPRRLPIFSGNVVDREEEQEDSKELKHLSVPPILTADSILPSRNGNGPRSGAGRTHSSLPSLGSVPLRC